MNSKLNIQIKEEALKEFGDNVKRIRKKQELTQLDLALKINGDDAKICRIENGKYNFKYITILILAKTLKVNIEELINLKNINFHINHIWE